MNELLDQVQDSDPEFARTIRRLRWASRGLAAAIVVALGAGLWAVVVNSRQGDRSPRSSARPAPRTRPARSAPDPPAGRPRRADHQPLHLLPAGDRDPGARMPAAAGAGHRRRPPARRPGRVAATAVPGLGARRRASRRAGRGHLGPAATGGGGAEPPANPPPAGDPSRPAHRSRRRSRRQPPPDRPRNRRHPAWKDRMRWSPLWSTRCWKRSARSPISWLISAAEQRRRRSRCPDVTAKPFIATCTWSARR